MAFLNKVSLSVSDYIWYLVINTTHQKKGTCPRIYYRKITRYLVFRHIGLFPPSHAVFPPSRAVFPPSPAVFLPFACRFSGRRLPCFLHRVPSRAVLPLIARLFSAVACRVSARCLPCFSSSPAVACRASAHRPAFPPRRVPCFPHRLPSPTVLPLIARLFPPSTAMFLPVACHVSARRLPCFPHRLPSHAVLPPSPGFSRRRLPCFCPSPAMFPPLPAVACRASAHRSAFFPPSPALFHNKNKELRLRA